MREFMGFEATIALTDKEIALRQAFEMMNAITDQGEGATLKARLRMANMLSAQNLQAVKPKYCPDSDALNSDYPSYSDTGEQIPSADAAARVDNDGKDHFERFQEVQALFDEGALLTWDRAGKAGQWTGADLVTGDFEPEPGSPLPTPDQIAAALNNLYAQDREANYKTLSQAVVGAIKGVTTVLDQYWNPAVPGTTVGFPYPSMVGSGDRMSTAWAVFGRTPDLSIGIADPDTKIVNHACQGLSLTAESGKVGTNSCAETSIFHTCRGSNLCKGMGGCGFVQASTGGGSCGGGGGGGCGAATKADASSPGNVGGQSCSAVKMRVHGGLCGGPTPPPPTPSVVYTAPSDNICGGFGGCAVPISACQLYPKSGTMEVWVLAGKSSCGTPPPPPPPHMCSASQEAPAADKNLCGAPPPPHKCSSGQSEKIGTIAFEEGERVEDVAFRAFTMVAEKLSHPAPVQQAPNDLRLAFPPST
jgi:hypothetical protein